MAKNKEHSARSKGDRRLCFERAERLAKQDTRARIRSSSGAFACECAEQLIESRRLCTAARRCRGYRGIPPVLLFFCRHFLFQIKRKCRNAGSIKYLIVAGRECSSQLSTIRNGYDLVSASADSGQPQGPPLQIVQFSRRNIRPYAIVQFAILIRLSISDTHTRAPNLSTHPHLTSKWKKSYPRKPWIGFAVLFVLFIYTVRAHPTRGL